MGPEESASCFTLAVAGAPAKEIASVKALPEEEVRRAIEQEVADRVEDPDDFESLDDALEYIRLGRLQRGMWSSASRGGVQEARQVLSLIERRDKLKKSSKRGRTLRQAVQDMLHDNNVEADELDEGNHHG